jgi:nicotinamidase-related amidase
MPNGTTEATLDKNQENRLKIMRITSDRSAGLIIDIQEKLFPHMAEKDNLVIQVNRLLEGFRYLKVPVLLTEQYTRGLGPTIPEIANNLAGVEGSEKMSFSCCDDPGFMKKLTNLKPGFVIIAGIEAHVCVLQTAIDLLHAGYQPVVVENAVSSRNLKDKETALLRMRQEGAIITSTESILFELTRTSGTELFKSISKLVK